MTNVESPLALMPSVAYALLPLSFPLVPTLSLQLLNMIRKPKLGMNMWQEAELEMGLGNDTVIIY